MLFTKVATESFKSVTTFARGHGPKLGGFPRPPNREQEYLSKIAKMIIRNEFFCRGFTLQVDGAVISGGVHKLSLGTPEEAHLGSP